MSKMTWVIDNYTIIIADGGISISTDEEDDIPAEDAKALHQFVIHAIQSPMLQQVMLRNDEDEIYNAFTEFVKERQLGYAAAKVSFTCDGCGQKRSGLLKDSPTEIESGQILCAKCLKEMRSS
jgi:hypothetical protein